MKAVLHDGLSARAQPVDAVCVNDTLEVRDATNGVQAVPLKVLRRGVRTAERMTLHRTDLPDWRLVLQEAREVRWLRDLTPVTRLSRRSWAVYGGVIAATVAVATGLWFGGNALLETMAPLVPHRITEPVGRGIVVEMGSACTVPAGRAALDRLTARLIGPKALAEPITVTIVDAPVVNALALPGGHVVVFRKLIDEAAAPEELAGVLAHEFAHVDRRHPNKALIRQTGLSLLVRSVAGDTGNFVDLALLLRSSRAAEAEADSGAVAMLRRAGIDAAPTAAFFTRQKAKAAARTDNVSVVLAQVGDYASSHPADDERAARFRAARIPDAVPALSAADWQALRGICAKKPAT